MEILSYSANFACDHHRKILALCSVTLLVVALIASASANLLPQINSNWQIIFLGSSFFLGILACFSQKPHLVFSNASLCKYSIFEDKKQKEKLRPYLEKARKHIKALERAELGHKDSQLIDQNDDLRMGVMMGLAVGDALGAALEFEPQSKVGYEEEDYHLHMTKESVTGVTIDIEGNLNRFHLSPGQWTDDTGMALCLADCLIKNEGTFKGTDLMDHFVDWWKKGLNNGFTLQPRSTQDIGNQIKNSLTSFLKHRKTIKDGDYQASGSLHSSGNGSLMRLAPVTFATSIEEAMQLAEKQSRTTHSGREATECAQLMAGIIFLLLQDRKTVNPEERKKRILGQMPVPFKDFCSSVKALAESQLIVLDSRNNRVENWNWKSEDFDYHESRRKGKFSGGYAMDALAMALHCVWTTTSFEDAVRKAAIMGGDADTVAAITGQIAGALYGYSAIPADWRNAVHQHDRLGEIPARALALTELFKRAKDLS